MKVCSMDRGIRGRAGSCDLSPLSWSAGDLTERPHIAKNGRDAIAISKRRPARAAVLSLSAGVELTSNGWR